MNRYRLLLLLAVLLILMGCGSPPSQATPTEASVATATPVPVADTPAPEPTAEVPTEATTQVVTEVAPEATATPLPEPTDEPTPAPEPTADTSGLPPAAHYDLGERTIVQEHFPEDSRFRNMSVQLNGVIAAPLEGEQHPVVVILHGTHPGCPVDEMGVDRWPCDPEVEQPNYAGFEYLVHELAARGYVALSININAENTFGFGEPTPGERLAQILDLHLSALAEAAAGGSNEFGVELAGRADLTRLVLIGHSRGGEMANYLTRVMGLDTPEGAAERGYGPVAGLLLVAPAVTFVGTTGTNVPLAVILPGCDGDIVGLDGQAFFEDVRLGLADHSWATTVYLEGANHNHFNTILGGDLIGQPQRPSCETLLPAEDQRQFLIDYAVDFLTILFNKDPAAAFDARVRLGLDSNQPAPAELLGQSARVAVLAAAAARLPLFVPRDENSLVTNELGGAVTAEGATLLYCRPGYFIPSDEPGSEPCKRVNFTIPGNPGMAVVSWSEPASLRLALPEGQRDLTRYATLSLRTVLDPLSELNAADQPQTFSVRLTDDDGNVATAVTSPDEPALQFPAGEAQEDFFFEGGFFSGIVHLTTLRLPLTAFAGVNLSDVIEIALVFDQTPSGTLFVADVDLSGAPSQ